MDESLRSLVLKRARACCEYCLLSQAFASGIFEIDHIVARQHLGPTIASNLPLTCFFCNRFKGPNLAGVDPKTRKRTWLFNPRRHQWHRHFRWRGAELQGRTAVGRATVVTL